MYYEYKVIPSPISPAKVKGKKSGADRVAHAAQSLMNEMAAQGWEYLRADVLPLEERQGLTGKTTHYHTVLVFCRLQEAAPNPTPKTPPLTAATPAKPIAEAPTPTKDTAEPERREE